MDYTVVMDTTTQLPDLYDAPDRESWYNRLRHTISDKFDNSSWWRHGMETFSAWLVLCAGKSPVTGEFPSQSQWRGALMFTLFCAWNCFGKQREAGDLRRHSAHYDVIVMGFFQFDDVDDKRNNKYIQ